MECKVCENLRWPWNPRIKNYCMRDRRPRPIKDRYTELTGCNIDGILPPTLFKGDENE